MSGAAAGRRLQLHPFEHREAVPTTGNHVTTLAASRGLAVVPLTRYGTATDDVLVLGKATCATETSLPRWTPSPVPFGAPSGGSRGGSAA